MPQKQPSVSFRVSYHDTDGQKRHVRLPAFYALGLAASNLARQTAARAVLLYRGYSLLIDRANNEFALLAHSQPPRVLCQHLRKLGLHWEANNLAGKVSSNSWERYSLARISDHSVQDRHLLLRGALR